MTPNELLELTVYPSLGLQLTHYVRRKLAPANGSQLTWC